MRSGLLGITEVAGDNEAPERHRNLVKRAVKQLAGRHVSGADNGSPVDRAGLQIGVNIIDNESALSSRPWSGPHVAVEQTVSGPEIVVEWTIPLNFGFDGNDFTPGQASS